ncbi:MAG: SH3 domain-containing protein [Gammaproteobacteria bacterium]|nr:SH3 domain-containing protein [Gammaproteobacteria bacterium]
MLQPKRTNGIRSTAALTWGLLLVLVPLSAQGWFEKYQPVVVVADPFLEMHTGPGSGYPVFYVAAENDEIVVLKRRTNWFKIRGPRDKEGWVHIDQMRSTLDLEGRAIEFGERGLDQFTQRRWETGMSGGDLGGARTLSGYVGYSVTPNIVLQLEATQILGDFSDGIMGTANILMYPFPEWRVSPFFTIGTGIIRTEPQTTVVQAEDREDEIVHAGAGANLYLSDRFILRVEYKRHTVLTSRDDNEEIDQWKAGFSVFF